MQCETCREDVLPVVLVDIDGTIANYHDHLTTFATDYWDIESPDYRWNGDGNFEDYLGLTQGQYREAKLAFRQGGMKRTMPAFEMGDWFVHTLNELPLEVWFTTTRPWQRLDNVDPDTRFWLDHNGFQYHRLLFDDNKYERVCQIIDPERILLVVDDLPEQYDICTELELPVFQVARHHNSGVKQRREWRGTLLQAQTLVNVNMKEWYEKHGRT